MNAYSTRSRSRRTHAANAGKKRAVCWSIMAALCLSVFVGGSLLASDEILKKAMRDELARSVDQLQFEQFGKPYFVAFRVSDTESINASATFGSVVTRSKNRARTFSVEIRVGSRALDNTNFMGMPGGGLRYLGMTQLPLDDDCTELRRQMWLATDGAYKQAAETFARKRSVLEGKIVGEPIDDFSQEEPAVISEEIPAPPFDRDQAEALVVRLSGEFRKFPDIFDSQVLLGFQTHRIIYLNSEGTSYVRSYPAVHIVATAATQAEDGSQLADFEGFYGRSLQDLPSDVQIATAVQNLASRLTSLRKASTLDLYNGPVLFEDAAAAEIANQVLVPQLLAIRRPVVENPQMERMFGGDVETFADRIGARVVPRFLTVVDNPLLQEIQGTKLAGSYKVDDEGVPARETIVVSQGILKTLLAGRTPVRGVTKSTGNRRGSAPSPSNLVFTPSEGQTREALRKALLDAAKERGLEYGIVIRRLQNREVLQRYQRDMSRLILSQQGGREGGRVYSALAAVRLYPDGREEPVRNLEIANLSAASFRDILAASTDRTVYTIPFAARTPRVPWMMVGGGDNPICSLVVPSLLFEEVTLRKPAAEQPKLPVSRHPYFAK